MAPELASGNRGPSVSHTHRLAGLTLRVKPWVERYILQDEKLRDRGGYAGRAVARKGLIKKLPVLPALAVARWPRQPADPVNRAGRGAPESQDASILHARQA